MPDSSPSPVSEHLAGPGPENLNAATIERVLADFRSWLENVPLDRPDASAPADTTPVDLATLVAQFVALRHEVNLQTRSSRAQLEQGAQSLDKLSQALALLERRQADGPSDQDDAIRPLLRSLAELHDALSLAHREVQRVEEAFLPVLEKYAAISLPGPLAPETHAPAVQMTFPWWARLLGLHRQAPGWAQSLRTWWEEQERLALSRYEQHRSEQQARLVEAQALADRLRQSVQSIVAGYAMSLQRLQRALDEHGLEPIDVLGKPFDPETMEVLEAVSDAKYAPGAVIEVVRPGYLWKDRVFRFAQVKVARP
jgi:molecular chaperone GrpE